MKGALELKAVTMQFPSEYIVVGRSFASGSPEMMNAAKALDPVMIGPGAASHAARAHAKRTSACRSSAR